MKQEVSSAAVKTAHHRQPLNAVQTSPTQATAPAKTHTAPSASGVTKPASSEPVRFKACSCHPHSFASYALMSFSEARVGMKPFNIRKCASYLIDHLYREQKNRCHANAVVSLDPKTSQKVKVYSPVHLVMTLRDCAHLSYVVFERNMSLIRKMNAARSPWVMMRNDNSHLTLTNCRGISSAV